MELADRTFAGIKYIKSWVKNQEMEEKAKKAEERMGKEPGILAPLTMLKLKDPPQTRLSGVEKERKERMAVNFILLHLNDS